MHCPFGRLPARVYATIMASEHIFPAGGLSMKENLITPDTIINQDILHQVEALCTQKQPPACMAACPLHVDARALCALVSNGDDAGAFKLYQKTVPFARIIACLCDAPCSQHCKRTKRGGAIALQQIESYLSQSVGAPAKPPLMMRKKPKKVAIAGGGLRGMAAANELARKGYQITIFEKTDKLGGLLCTVPEEKLPQKVLEEEIASLLALPVSVKYGVEVPLSSTDKAAAFLLDGFDVAFIACTSPLDKLADGDSLLISGQRALLCGRRKGRMTQGHSVVYDAYDGRSAAYSMDRILQGVSIMNGREKEGSAKTQLYTNIENYTSASPVVADEGGFNARQALGEASRCMQCECLECVKKCGFLQHYGSDPSRYVREVYNNLSIAMGNHLANGMINTCALCRQCEAVCPNGLDMQQVFLAARQRMVRSGKMPASAHEFALEDMEFSLSDAFYMLRHQNRHGASKYVFFPGCQLAASEPALIETAYSQLCSCLDGGVGLWLGCCGIMAHWAGDKPRFEQIKERFLQEWTAMGSPMVIAACPSCAQMFAQHFGIASQSLLSVVQGQAIPSRTYNGQRMVLHHACGTRHDESIRLSAHALAVSAGIELNIATEAGQIQSPCCGYGGLVPFVNESIAGEVTDVALGQLEADVPVLTYCVNCRDRYIAKGREAVHLMEVLYPGTQKLNRTPPTWSARQENRAKLKRKLLKELWNEAIDKEVNMELYISNELEAKLQNTHILHSDIAEAITAAQTGNNKLLEPQSGHFITSYRPRNVTFWVEYAPWGEGFTVYNAWCHRMQAILTDSMIESGAQKDG